MPLCARLLAVGAFYLPVLTLPYVHVTIPTVQLKCERIHSAGCISLGFLEPMFPQEFESFRMMPSTPSSGIFTFSRRSSVYVILGRACSIHQPLRGTTTNDLKETLHGLTRHTAFDSEKTSCGTYEAVNMEFRNSPMKRVSIGERLFLVWSVTETSVIPKEPSAW